MHKLIKRKDWKKERKFGFELLMFLLGFKGLFFEAQLLNTFGVMRMVNGYICYIIVMRSEKCK